MQMRRVDGGIGALHHTWVPPKSGGSNFQIQKNPPTTVKFPEKVMKTETETAQRTGEMEFKSSDVQLWKESLSSYKFRIESLKKPNLVSLDHFYTTELPPLIHQRNPNPHITTSELSKLMQWKLTRGKWRPRLLNFVSSLDGALVKSASQKAFQSLPDISKAVSELTVLKGVGPATASAVLAAYAPDVAPFMSDEAMVAALGNSKDYTLKQYILFVDKLQAKAKELSAKGDTFTPSDVERAVWSSAIGAKLPEPLAKPDLEVNSNKNSKRKRK